MSQDANRRIAIVTGASAGIGLAIAEDFARAGLRVIVNARRSDKLEHLAKRLSAEYGHGSEIALAVAGDAADQRTIDACFDRARQKFRAPADLIVVNAGRGLNGSVITSDEAQWEEMIRTNLVGAAKLMRSAATRMIADIESRDKGDWRARPRDIIVIGSVVGRHVSPFSSMYGGTKFAVHGMTEGVRREIGPRGVRVSLVEPGFVVSEFQGVAGYKTDWFQGVVDKIGPVLEPADVARVVSFIAAQPPHVHVGDVLVRPTRQDYP